MEAELKRIAVRTQPERKLPKPERDGERALLYPFDPELAWAALAYARTPSRVSWDLYRARSRKLEPLYDELLRWLASDERQFYFRGARISVSVGDRGEFPAGPLQLRGTVKNALIDAAKKKGIELVLDPEDPQLSFSVDDDGGALRIALDLGGRSLHKRGYRVEGSEAPLKETLAAQMLMLSRWNPRTEALIDPLAGSGTIAIEAAAMATGVPCLPEGPAVAQRSSRGSRARGPDENAGPVLPPAFADLAPKSGVPLPELFPGTRVPIVAGDVHTPTMEKLRRNLQRSGLQDRVLTLHCDFRTLDTARILRVAKERPLSGWPEEPSLDGGLVISNPPFGERIGSGRGREDDDLPTFYRDLAAWCRSLGPGWRFAFIAAHPEFEALFDAKPSMKKPMTHGRIKAWFLLYDAL